MQKYFRKILNIPNRFKREWYDRVVLTGLVRKSNTNWKEASTNELLELRKKTLDYVDLNHRSEISIGAYSYKPNEPPLLYASCYAALVRDLFGDLDQLSDESKASWIAYILGFQTEDGLFRDLLIECDRVEEMDWWGWRHLTLHVLMALTALGGRTERSFELIEPFKKPGYTSKWLDSRNWQEDPTSVSNEIQNYGTFMQYARDFQGEKWCQLALDEMFTWLDNHQSPETGLWENSFNTPQQLSNGVQTGYHLWLLYFYDRRPIQYIDRIIDRCLETQNRMGGFGYLLKSSACEDIDSIDPLVRLSFITDYRNEEIHKTLEKALFWVLVNLNPDGGWVFRRGEGFLYEHELMWAYPHQSSMFPTWFRSLSLAYISKVLVDHPLTNIEWKFIKCPGHQFWNNRI